MAGNGNALLRALLDEAELSNARLARQVVRAAAEQGLHLGTTATSVKRMLDGCQPRWPVPRLVAIVLSRRLQREITVAECGFADHSPPVVDDGTGCSASPDGTMRSVVELSGRDLKRRNLLLGTMFAAGAFAEPALLALTAPPGLTRKRESSGQRIGMADVEAITETAEHYDHLANRLGGGRIREQVVRFLHGEANRALHGSYTEQTGRALFSAVAHATRVAGIMADEIGRLALAQRYLIQAFNLAMHAGDRLYAADILAPASRLAIRISQGAATEHDAVRNARHAVALSKTAHSVAGSAATPLLRARLYAVEARGQALLGDSRATTAAVDAAMRAFENVRPETEPLTIAKYTETVLYSELGQALRDIGAVNRATSLLTRTIDGLDPWRQRDKAMAQIDLAMTYVRQGEVEGSLTTTDQALQTAEAVASQRVLDRIGVLQRQLRRYVKQRSVAEADERINRFLTCTRPREPRPNELG